MYTAEQEQRASAFYNSKREQSGTVGLEASLGTSWSPWIPDPTPVAILIADALSIGARL
jgi:hypothetical protein